MDKFRIKGFSDDSVIHGIGSLFRRIDGPRWFVNLNTLPIKSERSYLTLSQAPIMARQRVLNSRTEYSKKGYHKYFIINNTHDWKVAKVKECPIIKKYQKGDSEQYCFTFQIAEGITVYLPQFELARALFLHDGYLSRTAMMPDTLQAEFDVQVNKETGEASIGVMPSCTYKIDYFNEPGCRRLLSWILINNNVRRSYESIGRYQLLEGQNRGQYRVWDFKFDPPTLSKTRFSVKGWFDSNSNSMFVHEIEGLSDIPIDLPELVLFSHPEFTKPISGKGNTGYAAGAERPEEHNIDDEASASTDNKTVMIRAPSIAMSFDKPVQTIKVAQKGRINSNGKQDDGAPETASKDVSTDEATTTGELPNADWDNIDDQTDDSQLYLSKFDSFFKMLELLESEYSCTVVSNQVKKLPKVGRSGRHLLKTDSSPRCFSVAVVICSGKLFYILEVDTSDDSKSLSTKLLAINNPDKWNEQLIELEQKLMRGSLSWPTDFLDSICGGKGHKSISHPQTSSENKGLLESDSVSKWAQRVKRWIVSI